MCAFSQVFLQQTCQLKLFDMATTKKASLSYRRTIERKIDGESNDIDLIAKSLETTKKVLKTWKTLLDAHLPNKQLINDINKIVHGNGDYKMFVHIFVVCVVYSIIFEIYSTTLHFIA